MDSPQAGRIQAVTRVWTTLVQSRRHKHWFRNGGSLAGFTIIVLMLACAVAAPWIAPYDPTNMALTERAQGPSWNHPLGTDGLGRDLLSRMLLGARYTLGGALASVVLGATAGSCVGVAVGYLGNATDNVVMRIVDGMLAFPYIVVAVFLVALLGPGLSSAVVAMGIASVPAYIRLVRGIVLGVRGQEYVHGAVAAGATVPRIIWRYVLPNVISPVVVYASLDAASALIRLSSLSFIGMGAQPPMPEWGAMMSTAVEWLTVDPYMSIVPGVAIVLAAVAFNLVAEGVRDMLDPRLMK